MDSNIGLLKQAVDETSRVVDGVSPDQLDTQTPCTEWKVRDLLTHLVNGARMFAVAAEQGSVPDETLGQIFGETLPDDYKSAWRAASQDAARAFAEPDVPEKTLQLPFATLPGAAVIDLITFDVTTHAADLARATGQQPPTDALAEKALELGKQIVGPDFRAPGYFGDERQFPEGAPAADRLLAFAGRDVS